MKKHTTAALLLAACLACQAEPVPAELGSQVPQAALSGQATMRFLGFQVYRASLWVSSGFAANNYTQSKFALELRYLRNFSGADIAKRSIVEMRRQDAVHQHVGVAANRRSEVRIILKREAEVADIFGRINRLRHRARLRSRLNRADCGRPRIG